MSESEQIPLLLDLIKRGDSIEPHLQETFDQDSDSEIEIDDEKDPESSIETSSQEEEPEYSNVRELLLEEEIRLILDNHMEQAFEEISELLRKRKL